MKQAFLCAQQPKARDDGPKGVHPRLGEEENTKRAEREARAAMDELVMELFFLGVLVGALFMHVWNCIIGTFHEAASSHPLYRHCGK